MKLQKKNQEFRKKKFSTLSKCGKLEEIQVHLWWQSSMKCETMPERIVGSENVPGILTPLELSKMQPTIPALASGLFLSILIHFCPFISISIHGSEPIPEACCFAMRQQAWFSVQKTGQSLWWWLRQNVTHLETLTFIRCEMKDHWHMENFTRA